MATPQMIDVDLLRTPKLAASTAHRWYRYYAGYSAEFVDDALSLVTSADQAATIMDPWMGSGTTLGVSASHNHTSYGYDLNPAMAIVGRGRMVADDTRTSLKPLADEILKTWRPVAVKDGDLLLTWFDVKSAELLRGLVRRLDRILVLPEYDISQKVEQMSSLAAFFYVCLFETVTGFVRSRRSANPTWIHTSPSNDHLLTLDRAQIRLAFQAAFKRLVHFVDSAPMSVDQRDRIHTSVADSRTLPLANDSIDVTITSPPYLTRLDYVVGHLPELAILGFIKRDVRSLRQSMIGTPTIADGPHELQTQEFLGETANALLERIKHHPSYAAETYYAKNYMQYFQGMIQSIVQIDRVSKPNAKCVLVVQDSWFKEIRIDLAACLEDMAAGLGWQRIGIKNFVNVRSMAQVNTRASNRARTTKPIETAIIFDIPGKR